MTLALSNHDPEITASRLKELPNGPMTAKEIGLHHGLITSLALRGIIRSAGRTRIYYTGRDGREPGFARPVTGVGSAINIFFSGHKTCGPQNLDVFLHLFHLFPEDG